MNTFMSTVLRCVLGTLWLWIPGQAEEGDRPSSAGQSAPPATMFEFKIDVGPGASECFFQSMKEGDQLMVTFEVLRGADRNIDVYIRRPDGKVMDRHLWTSRGTTETEVRWTGDYAICIDNGVSRFSTKLVYLLVSTYSQKEWESYVEEMDSVGESLKETEKAVNGVRKRVAKMAHLMGKGRVRSGKDYYVALTNNSTVQNMSILLICVFLMTSAIQVYFVKNMFKTVNVTPTQKPRA